MPCKRLEFVGRNVKYVNWLYKASRPCAMAPIASPVVCMLSLSTWRGRPLLKLRNFLRCIAPRSQFGWAIGKTMEWTVYSKAIDPVGQPVCPICSGKNFPTSWTVSPYPMDSPLACGQVRWLAESLQKSFLYPIIPLMFPASCMLLDIRSSAQEKSWLKQISPHKSAGSV